MCFINITIACYKKNPTVTHLVFDGLQMAFVRWMGFPGFPWVSLVSDAIPHVDPGPARIWIKIGTESDMMLMKNIKKICRAARLHFRENRNSNLCPDCPDSPDRVRTRPLKSLGCQSKAAEPA